MQNRIFFASEASIHWQNTKPGAVHWLSVGTNKSKQFRSQDSVTMCHVTPRVTSLSCVRAAVFCPPLSSRSFRINTDRHVFCSQLFRQLCRSLKSTSLSDMPTSWYKYYLLFDVFQRDIAPPNTNRSIFWNTPSATPTLSLPPRLSRNTCFLSLESAVREGESQKLRRLVSSVHFQVLGLTVTTREYLHKGQLAIGLKGCP